MESAEGIKIYFSELLNSFGYSEISTSQARSASGTALTFESDYPVKSRRIGCFFKIIILKKHERIAMTANVTKLDVNISEMPVSSQFVVSGNVSNTPSTRNTACFINSFFCLFSSIINVSYPCVPCWHCNISFIRFYCSQFFVKRFKSCKFCVLSSKTFCSCLFYL